MKGQMDDSIGGNSKLGATSWTEAEILRHPKEACELIAQRDELAAALRELLYRADMAYPPHLECLEQRTARALLKKLETGTDSAMSKAS